LKTIPSLLALAEELNFCIDFVRYSRPFFLFPYAQKYPHDSFDSEVEFLENYFRGHSYTLGAMDGKTAWHLYVADQSEKYSSEQTLEIIMFDLDSEAVSCFFNSNRQKSGLETLQISGLKSLLPCEEKTRYDAYNFDPCGFSLNVVNDDTYYTIHITPESHCSYASFECNSNVEDFTPLVMRTLELLKPKKYCVVFFADSDAPAACVKQPLQWSEVGKLGYQQFGEVTFVRMHETSGEYCAQVCSFVKVEDLYSKVESIKSKSDVKFSSGFSAADPMPPLEVLSQVSRQFAADWFSADCPLDDKLKNLKSVSHRPLLFIDLGRIFQNYVQLQKIFSSSCRYSVRCNPDPAILRLLQGLGAQLSVSSRSEVEHLVRNDISLSNVVFCSPMLKLASIQRILQTYSFGLVVVSEDVLEEGEGISEDLVQILKGFPVELELNLDERDTKSDSIERIEHLLSCAKKIGLKVASINICQLESELVVENFDRLWDVLKSIAEASVVVSVNIRLLQESWNESNLVDMDSSSTEKLVARLKDCSLSPVINADSLLLHNSQMMAVSVIARQESKEKDTSQLKAEKYYISEGVFGAFHELLTETVNDLCPYPLIENKEKGPVSFCSIYGPSGDCLDHIWSGVLPVLNIHDYIFFPKIGSFLSLGLREFNDFSRKVDTRYIVTL